MDPVTPGRSEVVSDAAIGMTIRVTSTIPLATYLRFQVWCREHGLRTNAALRKILTEMFPEEENRS